MTKHFASTDCNSCANCMTRKRWLATYEKYLKDTGDKADVKWIARMIKTDNNILICLRGTRYAT